MSQITDGETELVAQGKSGGLGVTAMKVMDEEEGVWRRTQ